MKRRISLLIILCSLGVFAQNNDASPQFEEVILDSKPAYINVETGEIVSEIPNGNSHSLNTSTKVPKTSSVLATTSANTSGTHVVAKGETLYSISKKYGISLAELKELNSTADFNSLSINQKIIVNKTANATSNAAADNTFVATSPSSDYVVKKGETLYSISRKLNISISDLKRMNNLTNSMLSIGQTLKVK